MRAPEPAGDAPTCELVVAAPRTETTTTMAPRPGIGRIAAGTYTWGRSPGCGLPARCLEVGWHSRLSNQPGFGVDGEPLTTGHHPALHPAESPHGGHQPGRPKNMALDQDR